MYKRTKAGLVILLTGIMLANTALYAFADQTEESQSRVIDATQNKTTLDTMTGPGAIPPGTSDSGASDSGSSASEPQLTAPGSDSGNPVSESQEPDSTPAQPEETPAGQTEGTGTEGQTEGTGTEGQTGVLNESQAAELQAEQDAAQAEADLNNPLVVPKRAPLLQTTVLYTDAQSWSPAHVNDQQILTDGQSFCRISTFLEHIHGDLLYRTYSSEKGWTGWAMNGQQTSFNNEWIPVEAIQYRFAGPVADQYDIYYCATLSDGTQTGWGKNGETVGTMNQGLYMTGFRLAYFTKDSADTANLNTTNALVSAHADGMQVVNGALTYIHGDGSQYTGWAWSGSDRYYFIDSAPVTGWQYIDGFKYYFQEDGRLLQNVESLVTGPYMIKINKEMNCMTIYAQDGANGHIIPVKSFLTSVGDDTPVGTFKTPEKYRWRLMIHDVYTQYATRLGSGLPILIHSIIYDAPNSYTVWASTYNNLGIARSAGCIRLASGDAKWVYDNCGIGTTVQIYNSSVPGPLERPTILYEIPFEQTWDPTDPNLTEEGIAAATQSILAKFNR